MVEFNRFAAEPGTGRGHLDRGIIPPALGLLQGMETVDPGLLLGRAGLGATTDPGQFAAQDVLPLLLTGLFLLEPICFELEEFLIIGFVAVEFVLVNFHHDSGHVFQEIAVVGDHQEGTPVTEQGLLEPGHGLGIKMVGRFVQDQKIGWIGQDAGQGDALFLPPRQGID